MKHSTDLWVHDCISMGKVNSQLSIARCYIEAAPDNQWQLMVNTNDGTLYIPIFLCGIRKESGR